MPRFVSNLRYAAPESFRLSDSSQFAQSAPQITALAGGGFIAVWNDVRFAQWSARAQIFDANGREVGAEFALRPGGVDVGVGAIEALPGGGFLFVWTEETPPPAVFDLKGQLYDAGGAPVGAQFEINTTTAGFQVTPVITMLAGGGFVVAWEHSESTGFDHIRAQVFAADGSKVGGEIVATDSQTGDKIYPDIAGLAGGGFVVSWLAWGAEPDGSGNLSPGSRAQLFDASGNKVGAAFSLNSVAPGAQTQPALAALPSGGFVAAWADNGNPYYGDPHPENQGIWIQLFDSAGVKVGDDVKVSTLGPAGQNTPIVEVIPGTGFVVAWRDLNGTAEDGPHHLRGQIFDFSGNKTGEEFSIAPSPDDEHQPELAVLATGAFVVGWTNRASPQFNDEDARAQMFFPVIHGTEGNDSFAGTPNRDFYLGKGGDDLIAGGAEDDGLDGGDGTDRLDGGTGADSMAGGRGGDSYVVDDLGDVVSEAAGAGIDMVETALLSHRLAANVENVVGTYGGTGPAQSLTGNALNNRVTGSQANDVLAGEGGTDVLIGRGGRDILTGGAGPDILIAGHVLAANLLTNGGFETQDGGNYSRGYILASPTDEGGIFYRTAPSLSGWQSAGGLPFQLATFGANAAFNLGDGEAGLDMEAAAGQNLTLYQDIGGVAAGTALLLSFTVARSAGAPAGATSTATLEIVWNGELLATFAAGTTTAMTQQSFLVTAAAAGTGAAGANRLEFREIGDADGYGTLLDSVALSVVEDDGEDDFVSYDSEFDGGPLAVLVNLSANAAILDGVLVKAGQARDTHGGFDALHGIESVAVADAGSNWVLGSAGANGIFGGNGNDVFDGGGGADFMSGEGGNDLYFVDSLDDTVFEHANAGIDEIRAGLASYALPDSDVENLIGTSALGQTLIGNGLNNLLAGGAGDDELRGAGGHDTLAGGTGADAMHGGAGNDTYLSDSAGDVVIENAGEGVDIIFTAVSHALNDSSEVEVLATLAFDGTDPINLTGNGLANYMIGNDGANQLDGRAGADVMVGRAGNDTYLVYDSGDQVVEAAGGGNDFIFTAVSHMLNDGSEVEVLATIAFDGTASINLIGNALANYMIGNDGENTLDGKGGNDVMVGRAGNDTYIVYDAGDEAVENVGGGHDILFSAVSHALNDGSEIEVLATIAFDATGSIDLTGNALDNYMIGNDGANTLDGLGGGDVLVGRAGQDRFAFTTAPGAGNVDNIHDFVAADDTIALDDGAFAGLAPGALAAGAFVVGTAAADADDRIIYDDATGFLYFDADGSGTSSAAILFAALQNAPALTASDFTII